MLGVYFDQGEVASPHKRRSEQGGQEQSQDAHPVFLTVEKPEVAPEHWNVSPDMDD
jgi:hypothetical protein